MEIIDIDAESNGLGGKAFTVALLWTRDDGSIRTYRVFRCPIVRDHARYPDTDGVAPFVVQHVLPRLSGVRETHPDYRSMCRAILSWWAGDPSEGPRSSAPLVLGHVTWPVEARLLLDVFPADTEIMAYAPFPLYDLSSVLLKACQEDPRSGGVYAQEHGIDVESEARELGLGEMGPHHPLYDCLLTDRVARHALAGDATLVRNMVAHPDTFHRVVDYEARPAQ